MPARGRDLTKTARYFMFGEAERFVSDPRLRFGPHTEFKDKLEQYNPNLMAGKGVTPVRRTLSFISILFTKRDKSGTPLRRRRLPYRILAVLFASIQVTFFHSSCHPTGP
jgi:hypothetical protein